MNVIHAVLHKYNYVMFKAIKNLFKNKIDTEWYTFMDIANDIN